jgi:hypothetical protein
MDYFLAKVAVKVIATTLLKDCSGANYISKTDDPDPDFIPVGIDLLF